MTYTNALSNYVVELKYEDLPSEVIEQVKLLTLHTLGVSIAGCVTEQGQDAIELAKEMGGNREEATIIGDGSKVSCSQAAFANGTLADVLDWEDCSWTGHPAAGAIPAALALSENMKSSGKDYITSVVAGYEVYQRIAMAIQPSTRWPWDVKGWGITSYQIISSVVPAAKLLNLNVDQVAQSIGVACTLTPIANRKCALSYSNMYHYQHGFTCRDGILSALVAKKGINGLHDALDGDTGYWISLSDKCDWNWLSKELGERYLIMETLIKNWPANMWVQQYLDAVDAIIKEGDITADKVGEISVGPSFQGRTGYSDQGYNSIMEAQFSIPYCIAALIIKRKAGPHWYKSDMLKNKKLLEIAGEVKFPKETILLREAFDMFRSGKYPKVEVNLSAKDGRKFKKTVNFPKGHPKNKITAEENSRNFLNAASFSFKKDKATEVLDMLLNLDDVKDMSVLARALGDNQSIFR